MNFRRNRIDELLKEGTKHIQGVEDAVLRNLEAVSSLSDIARTSMGPNGMNKMVVNHLGKLFVTHDTATITKELEVIHPAAKIIVMAAEAQEQEAGDGTNLILSLAGELMRQAETLLRMGLHTSDIIAGYSKAGEKALQILNDLAVEKVTDLRNKDAVARAMRSAVSSKMFGYEDLLSNLIAEACISVCPKNPKSFNVDNVRVAKIPGGSLDDTFILNGFSLTRDTHGTIKHVKDAKIAVYGCSIDIASTETKSTVLIKNAEDLLNYNVSEEKAIEAEIKAIHEAGVNVVVSQGGFGEMASHFLERYGIMFIKCPSKFEIRRLCKAVGATALVSVRAPTPEELGRCKTVDVREIGDTKLVIFEQHEEEDFAGITTIVVRGATKNVLDEAERAVDDGVNVFKNLTKDNRLVAGAGAMEVELYRRLLTVANETPGLEQYSIRKFAESFLIIPKTLAESAGFSPTDAVANLNAAHQEGKHNFGIDIDSVEGMDSVEHNILDVFATKYWAIKLVTDAALTVLSVDQIIMARPAGGPKPRQQGGDWDDQGESVY
jgi:T-complex protein 1 subunit theta